ncbi:hypothetical protein [Ramlibacter albus]|uniref:Uncharacterized protein n=1 Tax=Ramlibacter albus TaxID=2079448 RepID=A0A923MCH5_9BURK|nr:hypothetical protein [Ramlibacter albus]MBC5766869.1 hypothetical protein [Ramlibacter albus]
MFDLRKLFVREIRARNGKTIDPDSDYHPSDKPGDGLEVEYQTLIARQFRRWGIKPGCVTVEVRQLGRAPDGFDVFVGMVRLAKWERESAFRMLIGLPLLESKVRKAVRGTWLADFSHFGGLWLHASEQLHSMPGSGELRDLLMNLVPPPAAPPGHGVAEPSAAYTVTSLPAQSGVDAASLPSEPALP